MANELTLYGSVGESFWGEASFTAKDVREQLAKMKGDITVRINSGGGVASDGLAIYNTLKDWKGNVAVIVDGNAASAASLIAMAGDTITMRDGALMLIHDPASMWTNGRGTEADHIQQANALRITANAYARIYAARAGIGEAEARKIMQDETWMDGPMALQMGFATGVSTEAALAASTFDYRIYTNAPEGLRSQSESLGDARGKEAILAMFAGSPRPNQGEAVMADTTSEAAAETSVADKPVAADVATALATERARSKRIMDAVTLAQLPVTMATDMIEAGTPLETALDQITAEWKAGGDVATMAGRKTVNVLRDERDTKRQGMEVALVAQLAGNAPASDVGRPFMDFSLHDMAAEYAGLRRAPRHADGVIDMFRMAMHTTSDFPIILENAMNKRMADSYAKASPTYRSVAERLDFNDLRPHQIASAGDMPGLLPVNEAGEIRYGSMGEKKETVSLGKYGIALSISRDVILNDDMNGIERILRTRGASVAQWEDQVFWAMFLSGAGNDGPTLLETTRQVFNTTDATKAGAGAAITIPSLSAGRATLRKRVGIPSAPGKTDGQFMDLEAAILLVGPDKETEAQQQVESIKAQKSGDVNPFAGTLRIVVTPRITGNTWYLLTDPAVFTNFMYGYLSGRSGPRLRMDEPFGVQGIRYSIEEDFGVGAIDFRGGWKNPGA